MGVERTPLDPGGDSDREAKVERLARKALAAYAMEDARLIPLPARENTVYQVREAGERFTLRICDPDRDRKGLMRELLWLMALRRDTNLIVPEPLMAIDGEILRTVAAPGISGFHPCMLFSWVDGDGLGEDVSVESFEGIGRSLATLHRHSVTFRWPAEFEIDETPGEALEDSWFDELSDVYNPSELDSLRQAGERIAPSLETLTSSGASSGVVHGDLRRRNILIGDEGPRFLGFDRCARRPLIYDLAVLWWDLAARPDADALRAGLLAGYAAQRSIPSSVEWHLDALGALATIDAVRRVVDSPRLRYSDWAPRFLRRALRSVQDFVNRAMQESET